MKIIKYKKIRNKYKVYLDDNSTLDLYEKVILDNDLLLKKDIDSKLLEKIKEENNKEDIYEKSLNYINIKMRSTNELKRYLTKNKFNSVDIEKVIERLKDNRLLNDELYIRAFISDKFNLTNDGPNKIKYNLLNEKLDKSLVQKYISEIDLDEIKEKLEKLIDKKIKTIKNCSGYILKQKVSSYFINLGYSKEMIDEILESKEFNNDNIGIKEYTRLYNKYSKKYSGYELDNVLRQKLYTKGFNYDEIKKNID